MGLDDFAKNLEERAATINETVERCSECDCLLFTQEEKVEKEVFDVTKCKNIDCKKFNLIIRRVRV